MRLKTKLTLLAALLGVATFATAAEAGRYTAWEPA